MAADTNLSIEQIELGLARYFDIRKNIVVPKVSWGLLNHEADLVILNKSGYLTEIEIKRSWSDFLADFRKGHNHEDSMVMWRYFAVPVSILEKCKAKLAEIDPQRSWGLMCYTEETEADGYCWPATIYEPNNRTAHNYAKRLTAEEQFQLARLGTMRIWSLKQSLIKLSQEQWKSSLKSRQAKTL